MEFFKSLSSNRSIGGYIRYYHLEDWYSQLSVEQRTLLKKAEPEIESSAWDGHYFSTSQTAGEFIGRCAGDVADYDVYFAEQLFEKALELCRDDLISYHRILEAMKVFYKEKAKDPVKWYKTIQADLAMLPDFAEASQKRRELWPLACSSVEDMVRLLRNQGDLPEAAALCRQALQFGLVGNWHEELKDLQRRMED